jgi:protein-S-isoprenylcysteine O-methyltransferase Ste14
MLPGVVALLAPQWGWVSGLPGLWNWLALILVAAGLAGVAGGASLHFAAIPHGREMAWIPNSSPSSRSLASHVLATGPYRYSRNPMYVLEMAMWLGWAIFYGSASVLITLILWCVAFVFFVVPDEERVLEARFGEAYLEYKKSVPRWFGLPGS